MIIGIGIGIVFGGKPGVGVPGIRLTADSIAEDAASGSVVGTLSVANGSGSYTFSITADPDNKFAIDGDDLETDATLDYETATSHSVTIEADNGIDDPISRTFTITVTNVLEVTLNALTLDADEIEEGSAAATVVGAVVGKTSGSTLSLTDDAGGRFALSGNNIVAGATATDYGTATSHNITLRETHADGSNSPRDSVIAITVTEEVQTLEDLQNTFLSYGLGITFHFNMSTFKDVEWASELESPNDFNPTDLDIDQWVAVAQSMGAEYAMLTAKHHDGFCLWPSATTTHDIASSSWYAGTTIDIVDEFTTKFRAAGIKPYLYMSIWDKKFEADNPSFTQSDYRDFLEAQITELLTEYGDIGGIWFDGGTWHFTGEVDSYPWATFEDRADFIRAISPNTLIMDNNHLETLESSDILLYEGGTVGSAVPIDNTDPAELIETIKSDGRWFWRTTGNPLVSESELIALRAVVNSRSANLNLNVPPDNTGVIPANAVALLADWGQTAIPDAFDDSGWALTPGDTLINVSILMLPDYNNSAITNIEYRVDGGSWVSSGGAVGFAITGLTNDVEYDVELRAINAIGTGAGSSVKSATPDVADGWSPLTPTPPSIIWIDPQDISTMFQERTGASATTPTGVGNPIGTIQNKGTLGGYLVAGSDAARPTLRQSGSLYYIEFDGSNDELHSESSISVGSLVTLAAAARYVGSLPSFTGFAGFRSQSGNSLTGVNAFQLGSNSGSGQDDIGVWQDGNFELGIDTPATTTRYSEIAKKYGTTLWRNRDDGTPSTTTVADYDVGPSVFYLGFSTNSTPVEMRLFEAIVFAANIVDDDLDALWTFMVESTTASPAPFSVDMWSITEVDEELNINILELPNANNSAITDIDYRVDGGSWVSSGGTSSFSIGGLTNGVEYDVELRAVNAIGDSVASDVKAGTPESVVWSPLTAGAVVWLDPSDLSTLFQERTGASATTPAGVGDPVGTIVNKGSAGGYCVAASDGERPVLGQSGGLYYLTADGTDDKMATGNITIGSNCTLAVAWRPTAASASYLCVAGIRSTSGNAISGANSLMFGRNSTGVFMSSGEPQTGTGRTNTSGNDYVDIVTKSGTAMWRSRNQDTPTTPTVTDNTIGASPFFILGNANSDPQAMRLYAAVMAATAWSGTDLTELWAYLEAKAGL